MTGRRTTTRRSRPSAAAALLCGAAALSSPSSSSSSVPPAASAFSPDRALADWIGTVGRAMPPAGPGRRPRGGRPPRLVELEDLTEIALERVVMAAVESYRTAGSDRAATVVDGGWNDAPANGAVDGSARNVAVDVSIRNGALNGSASNGVASTYTAASWDPSTPSPSSAAFATAAREEAKTAMPHLSSGTKVDIVHGTYRGFRGCVVKQTPKMVYIALEGSGRVVRIRQSSVVAATAPQNSRDVVSILDECVEDGSIRNGAVGGLIRNAAVDGLIRNGVANGSIRNGAVNGSASNGAVNGSIRSGAVNGSARNVATDGSIRNGAVNGSASNGVASTYTAASGDPSTPSSSSAAFATAAREEAKRAAPHNFRDVMRSILEERGDGSEEEQRPWKLAALLAAAILAAVGKEQD